MKKWNKISSKIVYDSKYFKVRKDVVELPNKEKKEWTYWDSRDSAMVIGMTEKKKLVMIKQYRYLVKGEVIEFPSGSLNKNEDVKNVVKTKHNFAVDDDIYEDTEVVLVNFDKAVKLAAENKIVAMGSALAVLLLKEKFWQIIKK